MIPRPNNRVVRSGDPVTRTRPVVGVLRERATVAEILGRDPAEEDIVTGHSELIHLAKRQSKKKYA